MDMQTHIIMDAEEIVDGALNHRLEPGLVIGNAGIVNRPVRHHNELFEVYRDEVNEGDYKQQRKLLKERIVENVLMSAFVGFGIFSLMTAIPKYSSSALFFAEKIWIISWMLCQSLRYVYLGLASVFAYWKPHVLLNHTWQSIGYEMLNLLDCIQIAVFFSVMYVDVSCLSIMRSSHHWTGLALVGFKPYTKAAPEEVSLHLLARACQFGCFFMFGLVVTALY